jgi:hypothetical protein
MVIVDDNSIWTREELMTLHDAVFEMRLAFDDIDIDWGTTALANTQFRREKSGDTQSLPWNLIRLTHKTIKKEDIWHEAAHQLDWDKYRHLSNSFLSLADICQNAKICISRTTPDGFYYRNYGWNFGLEHGAIYSILFGRMDPFADAFAAWVYESNRGQYPTGWTDGRALEPQFAPNWRYIVGYAELILRVSYSD